MTSLQKIKSFFNLKAKASSDLEDRVKEELAIQDPAVEAAKAILDKSKASNCDSTRA